MINLPLNLRMWEHGRGGQYLPKTCSHAKLVVLESVSSQRKQPTFITSLDCIEEERKSHFLHANPEKTVRSLLPKPFLLLNIKTQNKPEEFQQGNQLKNLLQLTASQTPNQPAAKLLC